MRLLKNNWVKIILSTLIVVMFITIIPTKVLAQGEGEGEANDSITARQDKDQKATEEDAKTVEELQKEDEEICKEEADGTLNGSGNGQPNPTADPYNQDNPYKPNPNQPIPPACQNGDTAGYIAANEGVRTQAYTDSRGYRTTGIGHRITGNEPFDCSGTITQDQVEQLYDADMATARNCAQSTAADHGVDWNALSPERQTVLTDMSFNMGCGGGQGVAGFDNMWGNIRDAQRTGSQGSWDAAGDEIMNSSYGNQVGQRATNNANVMRTNDGSIIDQRTASDPTAQNYCGTLTLQKSFILLASFFRSQIAEAASQYVPVQEQDGPLMDNTKKIEDHTDKIRLLTISICTHLRAIRRIQARFEQKEFVSEVGTLRTRSTEIEKWREAMLGDKGLMQTGGKDAQGNPAPLYVTNQTDYQAETQNEAVNKVLIDISKSDNAYKEQILRDIVEQEAFGYPFNTTITPEELGKLRPTARTTASGDSEKSFALSNIPIIGHLAKPLGKLASIFGASPSWATDPPTSDSQTSTEEKWKIFLKMMEPRNNKYGSFIEAISQVERSRSVAEQNARDTYIANQSFLPIRECEQWAPKPGTESYTGTGENVVCVKWKTKVPGIINKEGYTSALDARRDEYVNDPRMGSTGPGNGPDIQENATGKPTAGGGGAPGPTAAASASDIPQVVEQTASDSNVNVPPGQNNDDGTGTGTDTGSGGDTGAGADWSNFGNLLDSIMGGNGSSGGTPPTQSDFNFLEWLMEFLGRTYSNLKPLVRFNYRDLGNNQSLLYWASPNATDCVAGNDWLSQTETASTTPKKMGDSLTKRGELTITYPSFATTSQNILYRISCQNTKGTETSSVTIQKQP